MAVGVLNGVLCAVLLTQVQGEWGLPMLRIPPIKLDRSQERAYTTPVIYKMTQRIDHFSSLNTRTFQMRYSVNKEFYNGTGPMYLFLSGENYLEELLAYLNVGLMYDIAKQTGAAMYMLEHRYYGESVPNNNLRTFNMRHLRVKQALADIATFTQEIKAADSGLGNVIVFGGSYTGSVAAWVRDAYPNVINGAVSASGIFNLKQDNYEYLEVLQNSLSPYENCSSTISSAIKTIESKFKTPLGFRQIARDFNVSVVTTLLANVLPLYKAAFFNSIAVTISGVVQYDQQGGESIAQMCGNLTYNSGQLDAYTRLANYFVNLTNENNNSSGNATWASNSGRTWMYQVCAELGSFVTTTSSNEPFYNTVPLWYWKRVCLLQYGPIVSLGQNSRINQLNQAYGGKNINATRVVYTTGTVDPWSGLGLTTSPNSQSPVIVIQGSSHCAVLLPAYYLNSSNLDAARTTITQLVKQWGQ